MSDLEVLQSVALASRLAWTNGMRRTIRTKARSADI
jgi:hypothetical protein